MISTRHAAFGLLIGLTLSCVPAAAQAPLCYASPDGNDGNDGSGWASAKADIMACYDALPGVGGTIYIKAGDRNGATIPACKPGDPQGCGIWIMGPKDPNFPHPPPGWRRAKTVSFIGIPYRDASNMNQWKGVVAVAAGGNSDNNHPSIWLSAATVAIHFENLSFAYPGRGIVIGEDSNHVRTGSGYSVNVSFENVAVNEAQARSGEGPVVDITGGSFWVRFSRCTFATNRSAVSPRDDTGAAVLIDERPVSGIHVDFDDTNLVGAAPNGGGSIKFYPNGAGSVLIHKVFTEDLQGVPAVWIPAGRSTQYSFVDVSDVRIADSVGTTPAVENDSGGSPEHVLVTGTMYGDVVGPATVFGAIAVPPGRIIESPRRQGQVGIANGQVLGQVDVNRRSFSPALARFTNLAAQAPSAWGLTAVAAPDGTTNAGRLAASAQSACKVFAGVNSGFSVGDWIIAGSWVRAVNGSSYFNGMAAQVALQNISLNGSRGYVGLYTPWQGDGEWNWVSGAWKVTALSSGAYLSLQGCAPSGSTIDYFAPVLIHVPAGAVSDNEAVEIAANLSSYRNDATAGQVSLLPGEQFKADSIQLGAGPTITSGLGAPSGPAAVGSIYLRRDGAPGSTFYIYEKDGWKAE